jgi:hypothetical protein
VALSQSNRVETMAHKLGVYAERAGMAPDKLIDAYFTAVQPRIQRFGDVFHPEILHPARSALILLQDTTLHDETVLSEAVLTESEYPELRISRKIPTPLDGDDEWLMEELVSSPDDVVYVAMAERLDHARHLRFRDETLWRPFLEQVQGVYLPICRRVSPELAPRFERWALSFERHQL